MNYKLLREEYYNDDYQLNEQEAMEFSMPVADPYWLARSRAYLLNVPIFGLKEEIQRNMEQLLFSQNKQSINQNQADTDMIDNHLLSNENQELHLLSVPTSHQTKNLINADLLESNSNYNEFFQNFLKNSYLFNADNISYDNNSVNIENLPGYSKHAVNIGLIIPELKIGKKLASNEIYNALSQLADSKLVFADVFKKNYQDNLISALIYLPFHPKLLRQLLEQRDFDIKNFIFNLANYYNLSFAKTQSLAIPFQKLLDIYYLVEDSENIHGITDCSNLNENCSNFASIYCQNNLCGKCCHSLAYKEFCIIHDNMLNFYRNRMRELLIFENENNFDRTRTIRLTIRSRTTIFELESIFKNYKINFTFQNNDSIDQNSDNIKVFFRKNVEKIQFVYLTCETNEEARRLYENRSVLMKENSKLEFSIMTLLEPIEEIINNFDLNKVDEKFAVQNSGLLIVPVSIQINSKVLPKKEQRNENFKKLIETSLNITEADFQIQNCNNLINRQFSYDYYTIAFSNEDLLDRFYNTQPFYESVIFHKFKHINILPSKRDIHLINNCVNRDCDNISNRNCVFEFCEKCCNSINNSYYNGKIKCNVCLKSNTDNNKPEISNNYIDRITKNNFVDFINNYLKRRDQCKLYLFNSLKNSDFSWFRNIANTDLSRMMCDINKELTIVMDNPNYKRETTLKTSDKMYKVFTFQNETGNYVKNTYSDTYNTMQGFDHQGSIFIQHNFNNEIDKITDIVEPNLKYLEEFRTFIPHANPNKNNNEEIIDDLNFHLLAYGLDNYRYSNIELVDEVFSELRNNGLRVLKDDIQVLDSQSVLNMLIVDQMENKSNVNLSNFDNSFGRSVALRFENEKDALKLFCGTVKLNLPLLNSRKGNANYSALQLLIDILK